MTEVENNSFTITDDEAALYDRQIRLWGAEAQKKLREAKILVAGVNGVGSELIKNIVLAGIKSLTVLDDEIVTDYDNTANLFTSRQLGKNRAEASFPNIASLNPMVQVNYEIGNIADKNEEFFKQFDVVCLSGQGKDTMIQINNLCHQLNIKFYAICDWGLFGFGFVDLVDHSYLIEETTQCSDVDVEAAPSAKKAKIEENSVQVVEKTLSFVRMETALAVKAGKPGIGLTKRTNGIGIFVLVHVILEFQKKFGRYPNNNSRDEDIEELQKLEGMVLDNLGLDASVMKKCLSWQKQIFGELAPVSTIIGGIIAQDIIRAVSVKDHPIKNFFVFNGFDYNGSILKVGR